MPPTPFRVEFAFRAESDLHEIEDYWCERGESWRGEKYFRDLTAFALRELADPPGAHRGRRIRSDEHPDAREILAFGIYRIIYEIDEAAGIVNVLRFWHAHRHDPRSEL
jgi:plasmid stabilization system protein ParE